MIRNLLLLLFISLLFREVLAGEKEIGPDPLLTIPGIGNGFSSPAVTRKASPG